MSVVCLSLHSLWRHNAKKLRLTLHVPGETSALMSNKDDEAKKDQLQVRLSVLFSNSSFLFRDKNKPVSIISGNMFGWSLVNRAANVNVDYMIYHSSIQDGCAGDFLCLSKKTRMGLVLCWCCVTVAAINSVNGLNNIYFLYIWLILHITIITYPVFIEDYSIITDGSKLWFVIFAQIQIIKNYIFPFLSVCASSSHVWTNCTCVYSHFPLLWWW